MKGTASRSRWEIISSHIFTYFNFLNLVLAGLILVSGQYKNMLFMGIVITNAVIGIGQELKVKRIIDALSVQRQKQDDIKMENFVNVTSNFCRRVIPCSFCWGIRFRWTVKFWKRMGWKSMNHF